MILSGMPCAPGEDRLGLRRGHKGGGQGGSRTDLNGTLNDHLAVDLVDDAIDLLQVVRIRDDLVVGDGILFEKRAGEG